MHMSVANRQHVRSPPQNLNLQWGTLWREGLVGRAVPPISCWLTALLLRKSKGRAHCCVSL